MKLEKHTLTLSTGEQVRYEYDQEGDILEIVFRSSEATCAIELTESIILRFDWETNEPLSLSVISISQLIQPAQYGQTHFQLLIEEWPDEAQDKVWTMLQSPPLTEFLTLGSYAPAHTHQIIPMTTIKPPHLDTLAVPTL